MFLNMFLVNQIMQRHELSNQPKISYEPRFLGNSEVKTPTLTQANADKREAISRGINKYAEGELLIPSINVRLPIFHGVNRYTLAIGVAKDYYEDAVMGEGNYVLAGHNMEYPGVLLSDLRLVRPGNVIKLRDRTKTYTYKVTSNKVINPITKLVNNKPVKGSPYYIDEGHPQVTIYTCANGGSRRQVVTGEFVGEESK